MEILALSALCRSMSTGPVENYEVKVAQRHLLATIEKNREERLSCKQFLRN